MPKFIELSDSVSLADQMESNEDGSIVLINVFTIYPGDEGALLAAGNTMLTLCEPNQDISQPNCIRRLVVAASLSTTRSGKVSKVSETPSCTRSFKSASAFTLKAQWPHPICSKNLPYLDIVSLKKKNAITINSSSSHYGTVAATILWISDVPY